VLRPAETARATAAVVGRGAPGLPGDVLGQTDVGAIGCGAAGVVGAELFEPVPLEAGVAWWVGLHIVEVGEPALTISGATALRGGAGVQVAPSETVPSADPVSGAVVLPGAGRIPRSAPREVVSLLGPAPALHVSLEAPPRP